MKSHSLLLGLLLALVFLVPVSTMASLGAYDPNAALPICPPSMLGPDRSTEEPTPPGSPGDEIVACRVDPMGDVPAPLGYRRGPFIKPGQMDWRFLISPSVLAIATWSFVVLVSIIAATLRSLTPSLLKVMAITVRDRKPHRPQIAH